MGLHKKTLMIIETARGILSEHRPMTVRQVFYQLVSRQVIENTKGSYAGISNILVTARQEGIIPWDQIDDRLRRPRTVSMWDGLADFAETAINVYKRNVWATQENIIEVWLEKDALSGIFEDVLNPYGVALNVGRGYDSWTSIHNAALRYGNGENVVILYFGDFDPSGEDMIRSLQQRLAFFRTRPEIIKKALTHEDIKTYSLPPDFTKKTDTRAKDFIKKHGDISVELDALPIDVLKQRIIEGVESYMDLKTLAQTKQLESAEKHKIVMALRDFGG
jgi:hypothetical protein